MKGLVALVVSLVALQGCEPPCPPPQCDALSAKSTAVLLYRHNDTLWSQEVAGPYPGQTLRPGEIPVRPAAIWTGDTFPKPHALQCVTVYKDTLPKQ